MLTAHKAIAIRRALPAAEIDGSGRHVLVRVPGIGVASAGVIVGAWCVWPPAFEAQAPSVREVADELRRILC